MKYDDFKYKDVTIEEDVVTIPQDEYNKLLKAQHKLQLLEADGVDNWEWYDDSLASYYEEE